MVLFAYADGSPAFAYASCHILQRKVGPAQSIYDLDINIRAHTARMLH